jgi:serine/threonine protein kinase/WD40 repeat protein
MTTKFEQVQSIFMGAIERPAEQWNAYLAEACGADASLRQHVDTLLQAHQSGRGMLDTPTAAVVRTSIPAAYEQPNQILAGKYKLIELIGEGGMGSVWLAQQSEPVKRKVAIKLIKLGMDSRQVLQRFEAERQALATMDHPNIAKVLDGGLAPDGRPFFVMELVKGTPITEYCDKFKLTPKERLELFVPVCQAIQHAHQKGIIHRDIKPSNVIIALYDDRPVPKVIDFGVAKATGESLSAATLNTAFGGVIGTPQYMSPEQATLNNLDIDTRSDVYSLGILLYELLTGETPFTKKELEKKGLMEVLRVVREDEPPKPSTMLSTAATLPMLSANRNVEPKRLMEILRSELDWIVLKALEKNRTRRYETANGLVADINRYLAGEPVSAHPPSAAYLMRKFLRRHRRQAVAAALVLLALLAGITGTTFGLVRAKAEATRAERSREEADQARNASEIARARAEADSYEATLGEARALRGAHEPGWREKALDDLTRLAVMPTPRRDLSEIRTEAVAALSTPDFHLVGELRPAHDLTSFSFAPDGQTVLTAGLEGLDFWNAKSLKHVATAKVPAGSAKERACHDRLISLPNGQGFAVATPDHGVVFTDVYGKRTSRLPTTRETHVPIHLAVDSVGSRMAVNWSDDAVITVHDLATGKILDEVQCWSFALGLSPDGKWLAHEGPDNQVLLHRVGSKDPDKLLGQHQGSIIMFSFSADGNTLGTSSWDQTAMLWDLTGRRQPQVLRGHHEKVNSVAFSPNGKLVATTSDDYTARIWDALSGQSVVTLPGTSFVYDAVWSPDGNSLAVCGSFSDLSIYEVANRGLVFQRLAMHKFGVQCVTANPRLDQIATGSDDHTVINWDLTGVRPSSAWRGIDPEWVTSVAYSADGSLLATGVGYGTLSVRDAVTGEVKAALLTTMKKPGIWAVAFDHSGQRLASGDTAGHVIVWNITTKAPLLQLPTVPSTVRSVAFVGNDRKLVAATEDGHVFLFDLQSGKSEKTVRLATGIFSIAPDLPRNRLIVTCDNGDLCSLSIPALTEQKRLKQAHLDAIWSVALSADGNLLATGGADRRVVLRDAQTFEQLLVLPEWTGLIKGVAFTPSGQWLAYVGADSDVALWDLTRLHEGLETLGLNWDQSTNGAVSKAAGSTKGEL